MGFKLRKTLTTVSFCFEDGYPNIFYIELHHGGSFTKFPNIRLDDERIRSTNPQEDLIVRNTEHVCDGPLPRQLFPLQRRGT
uniref:Uncharacterized protein n=1 Tax=Lactuca sativa TaxID=4236 RepID=A0A9R1XVK8_LACSA|nr:hypothetical protein LSAT_V11C200084030 [Lactuca sativa]